MVSEFYFFKDMDQISQPKLSNWCWAACLYKLVNGLKLDIDIKGQCDIVSTYLKKNDTSNKYSKIDCCSENTRDYTTCNIPLKEEHFIEKFKEYGINCTTIKNPKIKLLDYNYIKNTFDDTDAPIIIQIYKGGSTHLILLNGYGRHNGENYILISDPIKGIGEHYWTLECKISNYIIKAAWTCDIEKELRVNKAISKDVEMINNINNTIAKFDSLDISKLPYHLQPIKENPISLFKSNMNSFKFQNFKYLNNGKPNTEIFLDYQKPYCEFLSRQMVSLYARPINEINAFLKDENKLSMPKEKLKYIPEYATFLDINNDSQLYKFLSYPLNYNIDKDLNKWMSIEDIMKILNKNAQVSYFE